MDMTHLLRHAYKAVPIRLEQHDGVGSGAGTPRNAQQGAFGARQQLATAAGPIAYYRLAALADQGIADLTRLPFTVKIFLENLLRLAGGPHATEEDVTTLARWNPEHPADHTFAFLPARVILQDFTGVPAVVDLAAMRDAVQTLGGDPNKINPLVPVDLVIDHSVQVDRFGSSLAFNFNVEQEYQRNGERYALLALGTASLPELQRRAARHRHRPPGEPRISGAGRPDSARGERGRCPARYAGRHRLAHDDDQRPGRARLGRRAASRPRPSAGPAARTC